VGLGKGRGIPNKTSHTGTLGGRIRDVITNVLQEFLQKTVDSISGHLRKMVDGAGAYIEF
jgi:hypothetical protein